jgi:hypothetical protein
LAELNIGHSILRGISYVFTRQLEIHIHCYSWSKSRAFGWHLWPSTLSLGTSWSLQLWMTGSVFPPWTLGSVPDARDYSLNLIATEKVKTRSLGSRVLRFSLKL